MSRFRTLIAEDEPLAREGLAEWVQALPELELVGSVADGPTGRRRCRRSARSSRRWC